MNVFQCVKINFPYFLHTCLGLIKYSSLDSTGDLSEIPLQILLRAQRTKGMMSSSCKKGLANVCPQLHSIHKKG